MASRQILRDGTLARWHAENLTNAVEGAFVVPMNKAQQKGSRMPASLSSSSARLPFERLTSHMRFTYATLVR
ncbi:hypothetical protein V1515DRAFT_611698 [Lipomyces mesembrius]